MLPGVQNGNADLFSQLPLPEASTEVPRPGETVLLLETLQSTPITATLIKTWTARDPVLSAVTEWVPSGWNDTTDDHKRLLPYHQQREELSLEDGCVMWGSRVVIPEVGHKKVLQELHVGQLGMSRIKGLARGLVWWSRIDSDIENTLQTCIDCQENRKSPAVASIHPWKWPADPRECLHINYAGQC